MGRQGQGGYWPPWAGLKVACLPADMCMPPVHSEPQAASLA